VTINKPIPHHNMAALHKLSAEGRLEETKMILGWMWDFWQLTISLPINKYMVWLALISRMITNKEMTLGNLDTTIGRLTHISMIIPFVHHFLSRLQELLLRSKQINRRSIKITTICIDNLKLMNKCLFSEGKGRNKHDPNCLPATNSRLLFRLAPRWHGRIQ
jgi:hypothetical protein